MPFILRQGMKESVCELSPYPSPQLTCFLLVEGGNAWRTPWAAAWYWCWRRQRWSGGQRLPSAFSLDSLPLLTLGQDALPTPTHPHNS